MIRMASFVTLIGNPYLELEECDTRDEYVEVGSEECKVESSS